MYRILEFMQQQTTHGVVVHTNERKNDYLYRVSLKCLIRDDEGRVLVVKETGRDWWDLPGGGMDHSESIKTAIAREMQEEVAMTGNFHYRIIAVDEPKLLEVHSFWQIRLIFEVTPDIMLFRPGDDGDEIMFVDPTIFKDSINATERFIYDSSKIT